MPAVDVAAFLRQHPVFAGLPPREVGALAALAVEETLPARRYIFMEGDPSHWFYVVKSGRVKIVRQSKTGKDVVLDLLGPGELVGGVAVIERRPYPATAQATERSVILKIPGDPIVDLADRHPGIIKEMALMLGRRLRSAHDSVKSLAADPVEARLAAALLRLAAREGAPVKAPEGLALPFRLTRQSLADMTGTTVETTIRVMSRWLKDGLVVDDGGRLVLTDRDRLTALAGGDAE
ncbi:MAG TPA: Crp/Fnr family transcriptional regulator [Candidatus Methylomirabilis sp.]|nr:Crp/Fnr family transcriptional regulator [Candidatus Methylomirabilis sp.]